MAATSERIERRVFLSHALQDKPDIQRLRLALNDRGILAHEDVLELHLGEGSDVQKAAIASADGFVLLLTPASISDPGVHAEIAWARETKLARPEYAMLLILRGLGRGVLLHLFGASPPLSFELAAEARIESAVPAIGQALGLAPQDATPRPDPLPAPPMAELVIEFEALRLLEEDGKQRAAARARVHYRAAGGGRCIDGRSIDFEAPLSPGDATELRWYLEDYAVWPFGVFKERANKVEASLPGWGRKLFDAILGRPECRTAFEAWRGADKVDRRITVQVEDREGQDEAAALLFALPWELLADDGGYLFEGNLRARVRRKLPSDRALPPIEPRSPLRVLLILARPDDERAAFFDARTSAIPLAEALDPLGEDVDFTALPDGTFKALREELDAAERAGRPYQVVHFDGHGVYDARRRLGQLCFENADDAAQGLLGRRTDFLDAADLGALLRERRVSLFVLEACQTAMSERDPTASVAAALLKAGVASVVAMSHAVRVETTRRFVPAFYRALAEGDRIGTAMVRAQHALKDDRARGQVGPGELMLSDWMVPVLFQEDTDARLFPGGVNLGAAAVEDRRLQVKVRRGALPEPPAHGFVGRSKALFAIERLLRDKRYLVITGGGGQGKTVLAAEVARWLLAIRRVDRVAFVSVEQISEARAVLDVIGRQLVPGYAVAVEEGSGGEAEKRRRALLPVERVLAQRKVLVVVDNLESVLPNLGESIDEGAMKLLGMIRGLSEVGSTRVILTSREAASPPLGGNVFLLPALTVGEGLKLIAGVLRAKGLEPLKAEEDKDAVERLVTEVSGHARSLVLLGELAAEKGIRAVANDVRGMMEELEARYPEQRERSLIASVRLSLRRLPEGTRQKIRDLAAFHGGAHISVIAYVLQVDQIEALDVCRKLVAVGLAKNDGLYLLPDPGLGAALAWELTDAERYVLETRWLEATVEFVRLLYGEQGRDTKLARHGTRVALADLLGALSKVERDVAAGSVDAANIIEYVTNLESLVSKLGLPRVLARIVAVRRALSLYLPNWNHARFIADSEEIIRLFEAGDISGAHAAAKKVHALAEAAGETYPGAAHDRALAQLRLGQTIEMAGHPKEALSVLEEAEKQFLKLASSGDQSAASKEAAAAAMKGNALLALGRFDQAADAYQRSAQRSKSIGDKRNAAAAETQLGTVWLNQGKVEQALAAYRGAAFVFEELEELKEVASIWFQVGESYSRILEFDISERAYKESLNLRTSQGDHAGEAQVLTGLGNLYKAQDRLEDAAEFYKNSIDLMNALNDHLNKNRALHNLGVVLYQLHRYDDAREAFTAALNGLKPYGRSAGLWQIWGELIAVERDAGRHEAAREARQEASRTYRDHRADGGEPTDDINQTIASLAHILRTEGPDAALARLPVLTQVHARFIPTMRALQAIIGGSRDPALADDPALDPINAVELAILLESLASSTLSYLPDSPCPCGSGTPFPRCHGDPNADAS